MTIEAGSRVKAERKCARCKLTKPRDEFWQAWNRDCKNCNEELGQTKIAQFETAAEYAVAKVHIAKQKQLVAATKKQRANKAKVKELTAA